MPIGADAGAAASDARAAASDARAAADACAADDVVLLMIMRMTRVMIIAVLLP